MSDARVFQVTVRILNRTLTESLLNRESPEHQEFSRQVLHEVKPSAGTMSFGSEGLTRARQSLEHLLCDCGTSACPHSHGDPAQIPQ